MTGVLNPVLAYVAGALTILSPCVLPLVPIVLGSAAQKHRFGPLALAAGLVTSFTLTGLAVATLGTTLGFDSDRFRGLGAVLLMVIGAMLLIPAMQAVAERAAAPVANWAGQRKGHLERFGLAGQVGIGGLLGLVWSPCVGPTLGAATLLAAQGRNLGAVALVMLSFGLGVATVLLVLGLAARSLFTRWRARLARAGTGGKKALGALLLVVGVLLVTGGDHTIEGALLAISPQWLTNLTTAV
ncbi:cytochrome c biogenesis CcdA family protein [Novosphingobium sp.]|uniref:cytochrome c biogenesis CcdA family protein n=1 Tax=Novosphingobium sp. TaxID=1874826 RepID=UPI003B5289DD